MINSGSYEVNTLPDPRSGQAQDGHGGVQKF